MINKNIKKNIFIITIPLILLTSFMICFTIFSKQSNININLKNNTNLTLNNLTIVSESMKSNINIPPIKPNETYKIKINSFNEFIKEEGSIYLNYKNKENKEEKICIIGYIEKGQEKNVNITIKNEKFDIVFEEES